MERILKLQSSERVSQVLCGVRVNHLFVCSSGMIQNVLGEQESGLSRCIPEMKNLGLIPDLSEVTLKKKNSDFFLSGTTLDQIIR